MVRWLVIMKFKSYRILIVCIFSVMLSACGFELRGYGQPPTVFSFISIYISDPDSYSITAEVKRTILSGKSTRVVDDARGAEAILEVLKQTNEKSILSLSGEGRVREFLLRYLVSYRLVDGRGWIWSLLRRLSENVFYLLRMSRWWRKRLKRRCSLKRCKPRLLGKFCDSWRQ